MLKSAASKVMWVGRATVFLVGLAVILALVFGITSTAFAHRGDKGFFHLGHKNVKHAVSKLVGRVAGPSLVIGNGSEDRRATALRLNVKPGKAPMQVNSDAKVPRLNADKLDGKDSAAFLPADTYTRETSFTARAGVFDSARAECDEGDLMIGGGYSGVGSSTQVQSSTAFIARTADGSRFWGTWSMLTRNTGSSDDTITVRVICADSSP